MTDMIGKEVRKCSPGGLGQNLPFEERWYKIGDRYQQIFYHPRPKRAEISLSERRKKEGKEIECLRAKSNITRAKKTIYQIAIANKWEWWVTLTIDPAKGERLDLETVKKNVGKWMQNEKYRHLGGKLAYLLVPEEHVKGGWHIHGLMSGLMDDDLCADWTGFPTLPDYIREKLAKGVNRIGVSPGLLWWPRYHERWGYCTIERLRSADAAATYITKYVGKGLGEAKIKSGKALYMATQGLKRAEEIEKRDVPHDVVLTDGCLWANGAKYWYDNPETKRAGRLYDVYTKEAYDLA